MILEELGSLAHGKHSLAGLASVSRQWQTFFEPQIWQTLNFQSPTLDRTLMKRYITDTRKPLVKKISFHLWLREYSCDDCDQPEDARTATSNDASFIRQLTALFSALSSWKTGGLTLELNASSPSDSQHQRHGTCEAHNRPTYSLRGARERLIGNLLHVGSTNKSYFPRVPVIQEFSIRKTFYRSLSAISMRDILQSLPEVKRIHYEPWLAVTRLGQAERNRANEMLFSTINDYSTIQEVSLWEAQSQRLHKQRFYAKKPDDILTSAAVSASFYLRRLAISHAIDANDFFRHCNVLIETSASSLQTQPTVSWPKLTDLVLTCQIDQCLSLHSIANLLQAASQAAIHMPRLRTMEVWAAGVHRGFMFRYAVLGEKAELTISATLHAEIPAWVTSTWEAVSKQHGNRIFERKVLFIDPASLNKRHDICRHLRLRHLLQQWN